MSYLDFLLGNINSYHRGQQISESEYHLKPRTMDYDYKSIFVGGSIEAQSIASRLDTAGIKSLIKNHGDSARLAGFASALPGETEVFVRTSDIDRTNAILRDIS